MAALAVVLGGTMGFVSAFAALILFNASWLLALALWAVGGCIVSLLMIGLALLPRSEAEGSYTREHV